MLYINKAKVRKLIGVRRVKKWIQPGETVDLDGFDARTLGGNASFFEPYTPDPEDKILTTPPEKPEEPADDGVDQEPADDGVDQEPADDGADHDEEPEPKGPSKKEIEAEKKTAKQKEVEARKDLKASLEGMTKVRLIEVAEGVVGIDVKSKDTKATILKQVLKASKDKGYEYVLKNS